MQTVTINILNDKALNLLKDLESLELIKMQQGNQNISPQESVANYKGAMRKKPTSELDRQLLKLRKEWV